MTKGKWSSILLSIESWSRRTIKGWKILRVFISSMIKLRLLDRLDILMHQYFLDLQLWCHNNIKTNNYSKRSKEHGEWSNSIHVYNDNSTIQMMICLTLRINNLFCLRLQVFHSKKRIKKLNYNLLWINKIKNWMTNKNKNWEKSLKNLNSLLDGYLIHLWPHILESQRFMLMDMEIQNQLLVGLFMVNLWKLST